MIFGYFFNLPILKPRDGNETEVEVTCAPLKMQLQAKSTTEIPHGMMIELED